MNVVAVNGSARRDGNTALLLGHALREIEAEGIGTELVQLSGMKIRGCTACFRCFATKDRRCAVKNDDVNAVIAKMDAADGILLGSPTYFADVTSEMKALVDRSGMVGRANGSMYRRKAGAAVVAVRRGGAVHAFDTLNHFFLIGEMIVPGSSYWNIGVGREIGDVERDEEGVRTMVDLGRNMAWLLGRIHAAGADRVAREQVVRPIGVVRSAVRALEDAPKQGALAGTESEIVVDPAYAEALAGLAGRVGTGNAAIAGGDEPRLGGKIIVLCWMDRADRGRLKVHPRGQEDRPERGVFSTRSPHRPNPISLHTVELLEVRGNVLRVRGMDAIDGTPVLDIKPHSPELDA